MDDEAHTQKLLKLETNQEETWIALRQFYAKNQTSIERSKSLNVGQGRFQDELDQVLEASQVLLDGLVALANVHPVFGGKIIGAYFFLRWLMFIKLPYSLFTALSSSISPEERTTAKCWP
jgi:hypothetical protein